MDAWSPQGTIVAQVFAEWRRRYDWRGPTNEVGSFWATSASSTPSLHMPVAHDLAVGSSDLLFAEEPVVTWDGPEAVQTRMREVLEHNAFGAVLAEGGELAAGLGGVYLRQTWDKAIADHPILTVVPQSDVAGVFRYKRLVKGSVWERIPDEDSTLTAWRHCEIHTPGWIHHELWYGDDLGKGERRPLTAHPATAGLPERVRTGVPGLCLQYVPNARPVPQLLDVPGAGALGRPDFAVPGLPGFLDALDIAWTSWLRDLRLGKSRIIASAALLDARAPGSGASLDLDREVYERVNFAPGETSGITDMMSAQQFAIRVEEHRATVEGMLTQVARSAGYSASLFGLGPAESPKTATEVRSVDARTASTREKKSRYWTYAIQAALRNLSILDGTVFGRGPLSGTPVSVQFTPNAQPTMESLASVATMLRAANLMSIETGVRRNNPDEGDAWVLAEVARIEAEREAAQPVLPELPPIDPSEGPNADPATYPSADQVTDGAQ